MAGCLCISIDLELAWGIWDKPSDAYHSRCAEREREIVERLLSTFERFELPATWAIVGRLLELDAAAAGSTRHGERIWYAPDLVEKIERSHGQEIGSHGFAHLYAATTERERLRADLAAAQEIHRRHGLPFDSFVFPRNQVGPLDLLEDAGLRVYRSVDQGWFADLRRRFGATAGRLANLTDKALPLPPRTVTPARRGSLVELPSSMLLLGRNGFRGVVHPRAMIWKAQLGLEAARRRAQVFHLWFHPSNFYYDTERQLGVLVEIVRAAARMRDRSQLEIRTMASFAATPPAAPRPPAPC